jgi:integrase
MAGKRGNNEGSVTRRPDGLWEARITLEGGKRKSFYAKTRQEATRKLAAALRDQEVRLPVLGSAQTVEHYLVSWLEAAKPTTRERTWTGYERYVCLHVLPTLGSTRITKLTAQHVQLLYAQKLEERLSTTSVHHLHAALHRAFDAALRLGVVQRNVLEMVDVPRMRHHEMMMLSEAQAQRLIAVARSDRLEALYVLALATGIRQGELLALRWHDVDLEGGSLQVRASVHYSKEGYIRGVHQRGTSLRNRRRNTVVAGLRCRRWLWSHSVNTWNASRLSAWPLTVGGALWTSCSQTP